MTENEKQEKLEKVIKGLECCDKLHNGGEVQCATSCPYWEKLDGSVDKNCRGKLICDALVIIKNQIIPRIMSLEEVITTMKDPENIVWLEGWQGIDKRWLPKRHIDDYVRLDKDYYKGNIVAYEFDDEVNNDMPPENYGKTWRCWTRKPDEYLRDNTPWDTVD